jgi:class 3 adenylate cyclase
VRCPNCSAELPAEANFCNRCGVEVRGAVGSASPALNPRSYTPQHLIDKILTSRSAIEGERKQLTVLFADVKGSMELAERLDPEDWHGMMDRFFAILSEGVHRFEGTVNQYTGDGIMALFGAPIAHEDHAQRACYAALHIQDALRVYADRLRLQAGVSFAVRIGINSGEVVVGKIGDDLRMDYTAQGHVVGLAARMEQIAEPGKIYATEHTADLAGGYLQMRDLGETRLKGLSQPLRVYELQGVGAMRTRFDVSRARGLSRFVGRAAELRLLEEALDATVAGTGQAIGIVAQAGLGKSRLCYELAQRCRARGVRFYHASSVAHERNVPLLPVLELMRAYFGINDGDNDATARDKAAGRVVLLDPAFADGLPLLFDFLGIPDPAAPVVGLDAAAKQQRLFELLEQIGHARGKREAVVFVLEDLHWIDEASAAFVKQILDRAPATRTLLVVNFRPELQADWLAAPHFRRIALEPLGVEALTELLADVIGSHDSLAPVPEWMLERSGGNPFYVEELVRALIEDGTLAGTRGAYRLACPLANASVPPTVHAILAARIDRLPATQKEVLLAAAVIGRSFATSVLAAVLDDETRPESSDALDAALDALVDSEFLFEEALYPERIYAFKHALTQEVSYGTQLGDRRKRLHASAARALERGGADRLDEKAAGIARHWEAAGEILAAAQWYRRAADWLQYRHLDAGTTYWDKVMSLCHELPESEDMAPLELAACIGVLNSGYRVGIAADKIAQIYERGMQLARRCGDSQSATLLQSIRMRVLWSTGTTQIADEPVLETVQDPETRIIISLDTVLGEMATGRLRQAYAHAVEAVAFIDSQPHLLHTMAGAGLTGFSGMLSTLLGRPDDAAVPIERALEAGRQAGFPEVVTWCYGWRASMHSVRGELEAAVADGRRDMQMATQTASTFSVATATLGLTSALLARGDADEARRVCESSLEQIRAHGAGMGFLPQILCFLAEARLQLRDIAGAEEAIEESLVEARARDNLVALSRALVTRAEVLLEAKGVSARAEIETDLAEAARLIDETGARLNSPLVHHCRARLAEACGDEAAARRERRLELEARAGSQPQG